MLFTAETQHYHIITWRMFTDI